MFSFSGASCQFLQGFSATFSLFSLIKTEWTGLTLLKLDRKNPSFSLTSHCHVTISYVLYAPGRSPTDNCLQTPQIGVTVYKAQCDTAHSYIQFPISRTDKRSFDSTVHKILSSNPSEGTTLPQGKHFDSRSFSTTQ